MNFYNYFYVTSFTIIFIRLTDSSTNPELAVTESGIHHASPCSIGLQFYTDVNNTSENNDFEVELTPDQCCLDLGSNIDCDVMEIVGGCVDVIPKDIILYKVEKTCTKGELISEEISSSRPAKEKVTSAMVLSDFFSKTSVFFKGTIKKLKLIAPLLDPYERKGYCIAYLDSKLTDKRITRNPVRINFDTRVKIQDKLPENIKVCTKIDEDPLNDCYPVNCEKFYNGKKSYYNRKVKRCEEIPPCITELIADVPNVVYDPIKNECVNDKPIIREDIEFIKTLGHSKDRTAKDIIIIRNSKPRQNKTVLMKDDTNTKPVVKCEENKCKKIKKYYFTKNRITLSVLGVVIFVQCCLICTMVYFLGKTCVCPAKKKLVRQYFNYRQDASVTTPLIGTSNIDTETTECQFFSESSNIDNKIKCYKACQKDKNNAKLSMSDDILSKCLNRRDWNNKSAKSELMTEFNAKLSNYDKIFEVVEPNILETKLKENENEINNTKKQSETKVNFVNETPKSNSDTKSKIVKSVVKNIESTCSRKKTERKELKDSDIVLSEREIKCHSYNYMVDSNETRLSSYNTSSRSYEPVKRSQQIYSNAEQSKSQKSLSTEKGAQASFSNDSIDDFLSERGMLFLPGENISKYSFSSDSAMKSSVSSFSSKTSKNNVLKNVLSLLTKRSKQGPLSDPGLKKSKDSIDLELIHMSRASLYSSSNNNESANDCLRSLKRIKDSRSSL